VDGFNRGRGSLGPWILAIARSRAIGYLRSAKLSQSNCNLENLEEPRFFADLDLAYHNVDRIRTISGHFTTLNDP
jgi:DNA-directed RNA polymerase specialized sigma24 family protein